MDTFRNLTGQKFNKLFVIKTVGKDKWGSYKWLCRCDCGKETTVARSHLVNNHTKSCGCAKKDVNVSHAMSRHGQRHPIYNKWAGMNRRCNNPNEQSYKDYGGRGITVCERWRKFENFRDDMLPSWKKGLTIERIDNNGNYCRENCKWVRQKLQARNKRNNRFLTFRGQTKCVAEWEKLLNFPDRLIYGRLYRGWPVEKALTTPVQIQ